MNGQEFTDRLRAALNGRIPQAMVEDNVDYYRDYINVEMRKGRSEEEVMGSLGDPRLIARTIIETSGQETDVYEEPERGNAYEDARNLYRGPDSRHIARLPRWLAAVGIVFAAVSVISLIFSVLSFLSPVILVLAAVFFMVKLFRDWLN